MHYCNLLLELQTHPSHKNIFVYKYPIVLLIIKDVINNIKLINKNNCIKTNLNLNIELLKKKIKMKWSMR